MRWTDVSVAWVMLAVRAMSLAGLYVALRRLFAAPTHIALATTALFALTPASGEAWMLLCNAHLAVSVTLLTVTCGFWARAVAQMPERPRFVMGCMALQLVGFTLYEQSLFAVPAFVGVLAASGVAMRRLSARAALRITMCSAAVTVAWVVALVASGYVTARQAGGSQRGLAGTEVADIGGALRALWVGFAQHNLWRLVEFFRTGRAFWWDSSPAGAISAFATFTIAVLCAVMVTKARTDSGANQLANERYRPWTLSATALIPACLMAAWSGLLLIGFAFAGFPSFSRMFYQPGLFVALALGAVLSLVKPKWTKIAACCVGVAVLWNGMVSRRYHEDVRDGSRMLRRVARTVAQLPAETASRGVLVIAQSAIGTFSTSAIESWSLTPAVRAFSVRKLPGPVYLTTSCTNALDGRATIFDASHRVAVNPAWGIVIVYDEEGMTVGDSIGAACDRVRAGI
ncbi:MAG: hypothetical protein H7Z74_01455 [Anaerolineae bacterium]|nr:hypothetical protein [Gemmatimonadaceae bacterium]